MPFSSFLCFLQIISNPLPSLAMSSLETSEIEYRLLEIERIVLEHNLPKIFPHEPHSLLFGYPQCRKAIWCFISNQEIMPSLPLLADDIGQGKGNIIFQNAHYSKKEWI
jgi:hypothetical protein